MGPAEGVRPGPMAPAMSLGASRWPGSLRKLPPRHVRVDIAPGDAFNAIDSSASELVSVAIFGDPEIDAATVDPSTVNLSGAPVATTWSGTPRAVTRDLDGDGHL